MWQQLAEISGAYTYVWLAGVFTAGNIFALTKAHQTCYAEYGYSFSKEHEVYPTLDEKEAC